MSWRILLWPLSLPYMFILALRNKAFDLGWLKSEKYSLPIISVGNISTGGTGKTPMTEFILAYFPNKRSGMVSRGYGRSTKGLIIPNSQSSALEIGDEPLQIYSKFPNTKVALSERRTLGINSLLNNNELDFIVLDDAFQHRHVQSSLHILLSTFKEPFYKDLVLPAGNLRESKVGAKRADIIVITKCPESFAEKEAFSMRAKLSSYSKSIFFSLVKYMNAINFYGEKLNESSKVVALTGIAKPNSFIKQIGRQFTVLEHWAYDDHHNFDKNDIDRIHKCLDEDEDISILTTEKDWMRLISLINERSKKRIFHIPIQLGFLFNEEERFIELIANHIKNFEA